MKSILAQQLGMCFVTGIPWLDFPTEVVHPVLYIQGEIDRGLFKVRVEQMGKGLYIPPKTLFFETRMHWPLNHLGPQKELLGWVQQLSPKVIILDPAYRFLSSQAEESIEGLLNFLDALIYQNGVTIVLIHHSRKPRSSPQGQLIDMGGSEIRGPLYEQWADSIVRVTGDITSDYKFLDFELRHAQWMVPVTRIMLNRTRLWMERS